MFVPLMLSYTYITDFKYILKSHH